jgi:spore coat polysaccharide biosynthesis predicted glycosyltransferase SpsG
MKPICVRFDGGGKYGIGNVRRSCELGRYLRTRGHAVRLEPLSDTARALMSDDFTAEIGSDGVTVLDIPYDASAEVSRAHAAGQKVLALDFEGDVAPDVIVSLQATRRVPEGSRYLRGVEYAIIAEKIRARPKVESRGEVLVIVGGGDFGGLSEAIVDRLKSNELKLCVVQGPVGKPLEFHAPNVRVVVDPANLVELMAGCSWAVTTGGTTMLEMLCLGKAVHVVPRTEQERLFAGRFLAQSALLGLGLESLESPNADDLARCESIGPQLIDGRGCERIAKEIESL